MDTSTLSKGVRRVAAPVREEAARLLRSAITRGDLRPGQRLSEVDMGAALAVSRTTVREAFRQLEAEGLIEVIPGKGPAVVSLSPDDTSDIYELREALECMAVELFTERSAPEQRQELSAAFDELDRAYAAQDIEQVLATKDVFYRALYAGSGNAALASTAASVSARVSQLRTSSLAQPGRLEQSRSEVADLVRAIGDRDVAAAVSLCRKHVRAAARAALDAGLQPVGDEATAASPPAPR